MFIVYFIPQEQSTGYSTHAVLENVEYICRHLYFTIQFLHDSVLQGLIELYYNKHSLYSFILLAFFFLLKLLEQFVLLCFVGFSPNWPIFFKTRQLFSKPAKFEFGSNPPTYLEIRQLFSKLTNIEFGLNQPTFFKTHQVRIWPESANFS